MRTKLAGLCILCLASAFAVSQEPQKKGEQLPPPVPPPPIPIALEDDLSYFENVWGLKKKYFEAVLWPDSEKKLLGNRVVTAGRFVYWLEFTRDIQNYDLDSLQRILYLPDARIRHVFFDQDNVAINGMATFGYLIHGEVSGVKGDVIRVIVEFGQDLDIMKVDTRGIQQAKKMAVRRN